MPTINPFTQMTTDHAVC